MCRCMTRSRTLSEDKEMVMVRLQLKYLVENIGRKKKTNLSEMYSLDKISSVTAEMNSRYINSSSLL